MVNRAKHRHREKAVKEQLSPGRSEQGEVRDLAELRERAHDGERAGEQVSHRAEHDEL